MDEPVEPAALFGISAAEEVSRGGFGNDDDLLGSSLCFKGYVVDVPIAKPGLAIGPVPNRRPPAILPSQSISFPAKR